MIQKSILVISICLVGAIVAENEGNSVVDEFPSTLTTNYSEFGPWGIVVVPPPGINRKKKPWKIFNASISNASNYISFENSLWFVDDIFLQKPDSNHWKRLHQLWFPRIACLSQHSPHLNISATWRVNWKLNTIFFLCNISNKLLLDIESIAVLKQFAMYRELQGKKDSQIASEDQKNIPEPAPEKEDTSYIIG